MILSTYRISLIARLLILLLFGCAGAAHAQDNGAIIKDFQNRVDRYVSLKNTQGVQNKQSNSANTLAEQKQQALNKTQSARPAAKQGDIFSPPIAAYFKRQIEATLHGADGKKVQASLRRAEPVPNIHLEVNAQYPKNLPLQSTPPTLLLNLPQLPKGLQYRVVGSALVLYDESSNLIVDFVPSAIV
jgi:hypothetical protein